MYCDTVHLALQPSARYVARTQVNSGLERQQWCGLVVAAVCVHWWWQGCVCTGGGRGVWIGGGRAEVCMARVATGKLS